jgi:ribosomal protein L30
MLFDNFLGKSIVVTQVRSENKLVKRQKSTLIGLGLRGIDSKSTLLASKEVLGMVNKVGHLIKVCAIN